jgi:hypothetical protein
VIRKEITDTIGLPKFYVIMIQLRFFTAHVLHVCVFSFRISVCVRLCASAAKKPKLNPYI